MAKKLLILEDGTVFEGLSFGSSLDVTGELVFCTGEYRLSGNNNESFT